MRTSETIKLPTAALQYDQGREQTMRRTAEQSMQDLRSDIVSVRDKSDAASSLAIRRHQFLLMGAP